MEHSQPELGHRNRSLAGAAASTGTGSAAARVPFPST